jgi:phosphoribosylanthranilate isomerase
VRLVFQSNTLSVTHTRVKICGITTPEDARVAVECGADAIGLVFYEGSPRSVTIDQAIACALAVPPLVSIVALFVDESVEVIENILAAVPIDLIQFHGNESAEFCAQFGRPYLKALRVRPEVDLLAESLAYSTSRGILLDAFKKGVPGGTGESFDWDLARVTFPRPLILAGGLNADNVATAIERVRPAAVDVSGGVELEPGIKSAESIRKFVEAVRAADQRLDRLQHE